MTMSDEIKAQRKDLPMESLVPLRERKINFRTSRGFAKILATIKTVDMLEPLCVYRENGKYCILDGFLRYKACEQLGVKEVPCLVFRDKEAYTYNRMVNRLSAVQETRMLRKAMETIDESTIAATFGMQSIRYRIGPNALKTLHSRVVKALDDGLVSRQCALEFTYVKPKRQLQILKEMDKTGDHGLSFARALVLKTPTDLCVPGRKRRKSWAQDSAKKKELVRKLEEIEKRHDFYTNLYRQYSTDLLKLSIYVRKLVTNDAVRDRLAERFPKILARFEEIVIEAKERKAG
jgi:ParB family chromosome partitioning protein